MRKTVILLIAASLLLAGACSKVPEGERRVPAASDVPVAFGLDGATKGLTPLTTLPVLAQQDFSVSAWYSPEGEIFDGVHSVKYFANHRFGYLKGAGEDDSYANHAWQGVSRSPTNVLSPNLVYWPLDGTLSFFCYAPYREGDADIVLEDPVTDDGVVARLPDYLPGSPLIRVTPAAAASDQADFLCAPPLLDRSRTDEAGSLSLDFSKHRMTQVEFGMNYDGTLLAGEHVYVESIELRNVVGSRYFYYTESPARALDCAWSDAVSPADRTAGGLDWPGDWPRATYRIAQDPDGDMGLVLGVPSFLPGVPDDYFDVCSESGVFYMLPQELPDDAMLWVRYIVCESAGVPVSSEELEVPLHPVLETWEAGKRVRYLLTLTIPPRGLVNPISVQVTDWTPSNNDHTPQPLLPHD